MISCLKGEIMPVKPCTTDGKQGRKWGDSGACYPCTKKSDGEWDCKQATKRALAQATAMGEFDKSEDTDALADAIEDYFDKNMFKGII
jgi:hypothetical protein